MTDKKELVEFEHTIEEYLSTDLSDEFHKVMTTDRSQLPTFLDKHGSFKQLKECIKKIENKDEKLDIFKQLMTGTNKKSGLFELPTQELIDVVHGLLNILNIQDAHELGAGLGLLSCQLQKKITKENTKIALSTSDSKTWDLTSDEKTFTKVDKKTVSEFAGELEEEKTAIAKNQRAVIISWPHKSFEKSIIDLMETGKIGTFIFIGEGVGKQCLSSQAYYTISGLGYKILAFPVWQLCYNDYFVHNRVFPESSCRSQITVFVDPMITYTVGELKQVLGQDNFCDAPITMSDEMVIQDLCVDSYIPSWIKDITDNNELKKAIIVIQRAIADIGSYPKWIKSYKYLDFWYNKKIHNKFPLLVDNEIKLDEYMTVLNDVTDTNGHIVYKINKLKEEKKLATYITTPADAEKYIWLDYSTPATDKAWKTGTYQLFTTKWSQYLNRTTQPVFSFGSNSSALLR